MSAKFTKVNQYIFDPKAWAFNLPSGWTCPGAEKCLAKANKETGKIWDGPDQEFKCYSAVGERFPSVRKRYWENLEAVKGKSDMGMANAIHEAIPRSAKRIRIHSAGDFFSLTYFVAWMNVVTWNPDIHFWAFTKSIPFWVKNFGLIPDNINLTASYGGKHDDMIGKHFLKSARVVYSMQEAYDLGLEIDTDDRLAAYGDKSFALLENFSK